MSAPTNVTAIAAKETPYGCGVRLVDGQAFVETDRALVQGIVRRPAVSRNSAPIGEELTVTTTGGLQAEITPGRPAWEEIRKGKLVDAQA